MRAIKVGRSFVLRLLLSALLIAFVVTRVDLSRVIDLLASIRPHFFLIALLVVVLERVIFSYKWNLLLATKKLDLPLIRVIKIYYISNFISTFLPSSIGVDVLRAYSLNKHNHNLPDSISSVVVDKIVSTIASLVLPLASVLFFSNIIGRQPVLLTIIIITAGLGVFLILALNRSLVHRALDRLSAISSTLKVQAQKVYDSFSGYMAFRRVLFYVFLLSLTVQAVRVTGIYFLSLALNQDTSVIYFFAFVPVIIILTMLPIAVGGIGVREGAFVYFFSQAGMPTSEAFALSLLVYVLVMISIIPGGIAYLFEGVSANKRELIAANDSRRRESG